MIVPSEPLLFMVSDDGTLPNSKLPVLIYKNVLQGPPELLPAAFEILFERNDWRNSWKAGIFTYHHYHSITHEVLGVCQGHTVLQLGGEKGIKLIIEQGDVIVIPAGVAHKNALQQDQIVCIGAYPDGKSYDINYGKAGERPETDKNIKKVPLPDTDPVFGNMGNLIKIWRQYLGRPQLYSK
jgi:uncharacterized protein YjlB